MQHFLNFLPLPHGQGSFLWILITNLTPNHGITHDFRKTIFIPLVLAK
jgi:hypothetical protein